MSHWRLTRLREKTKPEIARDASSPASALSFRSGPGSPVLQLQRTLGNRRVAELIQARRLAPEGRIIRVQRKRTVASADDPYEQKADRVARQVIRIPANFELTPHELTHVVESPLQRACPACAANKEELTGDDTGISLTPSANTATLFIQRDKIEHRALTWDDFQGKVPKKPKFDAATFSSFDDPDLKALIPKNAAVDTGEPCTAKGKTLTRFTVDITIDPAQIEVKSFMDQEKSWHQSWTTDEPARRKKCEKEFSSKCEKAFKNQFAKIKKKVATEKAACEETFGKMEKEAKKQCASLETDCKAAFKGGDSSFTVKIDGNSITANTAKECTKVLLPGCVTASMQGREFSETFGTESATATTKAECKTKFSSELEKLLKDQITWEATKSGASATVNKIEDCRTTFLDACAADLMEASSNDLLKHEQAHFDLTDAIAQKAQNDLRSLVEGLPTEVDGCGQKTAEAEAKKVLASESTKMSKNYAANKKLLKDKQAQYDKETKHGTVEEKQAAWEEKITEGF